MTYSPVISLIIVESGALSGDRFEEAGRVLVCVRTRSTNMHHPSVLSVPTQRMPADLFQAIKRSCRVSPVGKNSTALDADWIDSSQGSGHSPVIYAVESLLSQKLGISEGERGLDACVFRAKPVWLERGRAAYPKRDSEDIEYEAIDMLGVLVVVSNPEIFPASTYSYNPILWTPISHFLLSYEQKNVLCVDPALDAVELCIHGVCVATAYAYLKKYVVTQTASANANASVRAA